MSLSPCIRLCVLEATSLDKLLLLPRHDEFALVLPHSRRCRAGQPDRPASHSQARRHRVHHRGERQRICLVNAPSERTVTWQEAIAAAKLLIEKHIQSGEAVEEFHARAAA
jgi:hypothetical protein